MQRANDALRKTIKTDPKKLIDKVKEMSIKNVDDLEVAEIAKEVKAEGTMAAGLSYSPTDD